MSKKLFTEEEIIILKQNKYVKKVTSKGITYTDEFKRIFIDENGNGKLPRIIFEECGFNIDIIGMQMKLLQVENELLKKLDMIERRVLKKK